MNQIRLHAALILLFFGSSASFAGELKAGGALDVGGKLTSPNGRYSLVMQTDGNLVWYDGTIALWDTGTCGAKGAMCEMRADGQLVVYEEVKGKLVACWVSRTSKPGALLSCQNDGNLVIYAAQTPIWDAKGNVQKKKLRKADSPGRAVAKQLLLGPVISTGILVGEAISGDDEYAANQDSGRATADERDALVSAALVKSGEVKFENEVVEKVWQTKLYETLPGIPRTIVLKEGVETALTVSGTVGTEIGVKATLGSEAIAAISGEIKTKVEVTLGVTMTKSISVEDTFYLNGSDQLKVRIVWLEQYRKGTAVLLDGRKVEVLVRTGLRVKPEKVE